MSRVRKLKNKIGFLSTAAAGGYEEGRGRLGDRFDHIDPSDRFGQECFEDSEAEMARISLNIALSKANLSHGDLNLLVAGDLQNQCTASSGGLFSFGIPYIGVYGACSTCTEGIMTLSAFMDAASDPNFLGAAVTSSHNSSAEKQFRMPLEYGGVRPPSAQWTATAAASFILGFGEYGAYISEYMPGRIIDGASTDATNMGAAMSFAAADSIISYFEETGHTPEDFDYIVTGDLGRVGTDILCDILSERLPRAERRHIDCGLLLYDKDIQDCHSGASGCGTSASVLSLDLLPSIKSREVGDILFLSTGALMNPTSILRGNNIFGIAPLIRINGEKI